MELIECGKIINTHGVRGDVKIMPYADTPDEVAELKKIFVGKDKTEYKVLSGRVHGTNVLMHLENVNDMDAAALLKNRLIYMVKDKSKLKPGQYYIADVIGLKVIDSESGEEYGEITDVYTGIANDAYEIKLKDGRQILFPAIKDVVKSVDTDNKIMKITPLVGMFDI